MKYQKYMKKNKKRFRRKKDSRSLLGIRFNRSLKTRMS